MFKKESINYIDIARRCLFLAWQQLDKKCDTTLSKQISLTPSLMPASRKRNERSWAIELIALIKKIAGANDLIIKSAGGEDTLATDHTFKMFPDLLLFGDTDQNVILQGSS